jgi:hypothetical protein
MPPLVIWLGIGLLLSVIAIRWVVLVLWMRPWGG